MISLSPLFPKWFAIDDIWAWIRSYVDSSTSSSQKTWFLLFLIPVFKKNSANSNRFSKHLQLCRKHSYSFIDYNCMDIYMEGEWTEKATTAVSQLLHLPLHVLMETGFLLTSLILAKQLYLHFQLMQTIVIVFGLTQNIQWLADVYSSAFVSSVKYSVVYFLFTWNSQIFLFIPEIYLETGRTLQKLNAHQEVKSYSFCDREWLDIFAISHDFGSIQLTDQFNGICYFEIFNIMSSTHLISFIGLYVYFYFSRIANVQSNELYMQFFYSCSHLILSQCVSMLKASYKSIWKCYFLFSMFCSYAYMYKQTKVCIQYYSCTRVQPVFEINARRNRRHSNTWLNSSQNTYDQCIGVRRLQDHVTEMMSMEKRRLIWWECPMES